MEPTTAEQALACRERSRGLLAVVRLCRSAVCRFPTRASQALIDSSIRNIWQGQRDQSRGCPSFKSVPRVTGGCGIVDAPFRPRRPPWLRAGQDLAGPPIDYTAPVITNRPARLKRSVPSMTRERHRAVDVRATRPADAGSRVALIGLAETRTSGRLHPRTFVGRACENDTPLDDGPYPPGEIDGGDLPGPRHRLSRGPSFRMFTGTCSGCGLSIQGAHWLEKEDAASRWQKRVRRPRGHVPPALWPVTCAMTATAARMCPSSCRMRL